MGKGAFGYFVVDAELSGAVPITTGAVSPLSSRWARRLESRHEYRTSLVAALPILRKGDNVVHGGLYGRQLLFLYVFDPVFLPQGGLRNIAQGCGRSPLPWVSGT